MQQYDRDIELDIILPGVRAHNKKQIFMALSDALEQALRIPSPIVCRELLHSEEQRPCITEGGVAIIELQMRNIFKPMTVLARLEEPVDFEAADGHPVDLLCLMVYPKRENADHLRRLSRISRLFRNEELCGRLRETQDEVSIRALIHNPDGWMIAA